MVRRTTDMRNRAIRSPMVLGIGGAILGALAARVIRNMTANRREERIEWEPADAYEYGYEAGGYYGNGDVGGREDREGLTDRVRARAGNVGHDLKERAADLKDRAADLKDRASNAIDEARDTVSEKVSHLRERIPSKEDVKGYASRGYRATSDYAGRGYRYTTEEQPVLGGLLALGAGLALGMVLPLSEQEERILVPARERAAENLGMLEDRVRDLAGKLDEKIGRESQGQGSDRMSSEKSGLGGGKTQSTAGEPYVGGTYTGGMAGRGNVGSQTTQGSPGSQGTMSSGLTGASVTSPSTPSTIGGTGSSNLGGVKKNPTGGGTGGTGGGNLGGR